jgi:hypothetical protein
LQTDRPVNVLHRNPVLCAWVAVDVPDERTTKAAYSTDSACYGEFLRRTNFLYNGIKLTGATHQMAGLRGNLLFDWSYQPFRNCPKLPEILRRRNQSAVRLLKSREAENLFSGNSKTMNLPKIQITPLWCAVAVFLFGSAVCQPTIGQVEGATLMQPVDKPVGMLSSDTTTLLQQPNIRRDLELTQDQIDQLSKIRQRHESLIKDVMTEYRQLARSMEPAERAAFMKDLAAKRKQSQEEMETEVGEILLPFQLKRMEQIKVQNQIARLGESSASPILHPMFRDKLNLTKEQEERINAKMAEVKKQLDEDIAELRRKAANEILNELTDEQRKTYNEMIGEPIKTPKEIDK